VHRLRRSQWPTEIVPEFIAHLVCLQFRNHHIVLRLFIVVTRGNGQSPHLLLAISSFFTLTAQRHSSIPSFQLGSRRENSKSRIIMPCPGRERTLLPWPCAPCTFMASTSSESTLRGRFPNRRRNPPEDTRDGTMPAEEFSADRRSSSMDHCADSDESTSLPSTQREPPDRVGARSRADGASSWIPPSSIADPVKRQAGGGKGRMVGAAGSGRAS
jgi:hypothetical protein